MAEQTITYFVGKDGKITVDVQGVKGASCKDLVKDTVDRLGVVLTTELKPEYYDTTENKDNVQNKF